LADFDGAATFVMRNRDPDWSSFNLTKPSDLPGRVLESVQGRVARLQTIATELGHNRIDVLKLDIEGAEYEVIPQILAGELLPVQLLVEFHYFEQPQLRLAQTAQLIQRLNTAGYRVFARSPVGYEFSFVRIR
jgi:hypothetical protein